jgi:hypothetical protein
MELEKDSRYLYQEQPKEVKDAMAEESDIGQN